MPKVAVLDLGSNTVKITVAEVDDGGIRVLDERIRATRIVEGRVGPQLDPSAVERTVAAIESMSTDLPPLRVGVATASLRGAAEADAVLDALRSRAGFEVEVISGDREAELGFLGPQTLFGSKMTGSFDIGGKSTEVSGLRSGDWSGQSHPIGALTAAQDLPDPPDAETRRTMQQRCLEGLRDLEGGLDDGALIGVSGTTLAILGISRRIFHLRDLIPTHDGGRVHKSEVGEMIDAWSGVPAAERVRGDLIPPLRADALIGGMILVHTLLDCLGQDVFLVTPRGVRHGLLVELQRKKTGIQ